MTFLCFEAKTMVFSTLFEVLSLVLGPEAPEEPFPLPYLYPAMIRSDAIVAHPGVSMSAWEMLGLGIAKLVMISTWKALEIHKESIKHHQKSIKHEWRKKMTTPLKRP